MSSPVEPEPQEPPGRDLTPEEIATDAALVAALDCIRRPPDLPEAVQTVLEGRR